MAGEDLRQRTPLGRVLTSVNRAVRVQDDRAYSLLGVRWYCDGARLHATMDGSKLQTPSLNRVEAGDVTYNKMWVTKGAFAVLDARFDGIFATNEYPTFRPDAARIDGGYLWYVMQTEAFQADAAGLCRGSTSRARLNPVDFLRIVVNLPPLAEQKKIAAILSSVDDAIRATEAVIEQTRRVKQALLQELLTQGIGHTRFRMTEIGEIPEGWEVHRLSHFLPKGAVQNGMYLPESEYGAGVPIVRIDSYDHGGRVRVAALKRLGASPTDIATFGLQANDLLLNRVNSLSHIAKAALVPALAEPTVFESNMMRLRLPANSQLLPGFLMLALCLPSAVTYFQRRAKKAVAQTSVNQQDVAAFKLAVPPISEQAEIVVMIDGVSDHEEANQAALAGLTVTKSALLSALLTGRVRV